MPDTISPVTREEDYLAAIAGQDVTPPTPVTRKEEWLDLIADKVDDLAGDLSTAEGEIDDLQDIVPTPEATDVGKVLTAGDDGTASWQPAASGGSVYDMIVEISITYDDNSNGYVVNSVSETHADIIAAQAAGKLIAGKIADTDGPAYLADFYSQGTGSTVAAIFTASITSVATNTIFYSFIIISGTSDADWACASKEAVVSATIS